MANSVTNVQIEDVLSSIRKLVSEEVRSQGREVANPQRAVQKPSEPARPAREDRLILTPSLRVDTRNTPEDEAPDAVEDHGEEARFIHAEPEDDQGEADLLNLMERVRKAGEERNQIEAKRPKGIAPLAEPEAPAERKSPEKSIEAALAALGVGKGFGVPEEAEAAPVAEAADVAEPEEEDLAAPGLDLADRNDDFAELQQGARTGLDDADEVMIGASAADAPLADAEDDVVPTFLRHRDYGVFNPRVAVVETVVTKSGGDWEPEADEETDAAPGPQSARLPWEEPEVAAAAQPETDDSDTDWMVDPIDFEEVRTAEDDAADADVAKYVSDEAVAEDLAARMAEPEDAGEPLRDSVEQIAETFAASQTAEAWEDDGQSAAAYQDDDRATLTADEPALIDEDMLRDLVADIVRQELQGALGERITRNVRKLVRREIQRALAAHEII